MSQSRPEIRWPTVHTAPEPDHDGDQNNNASSSSSPSTWPSLSMNTGDSTSAPTSTETTPLLPSSPLLRRISAAQKDKGKDRQWRVPAIPSPSLTLVNNGSVARDHLASERTFLAYVRTSLAIASTGVALVQLFAISQTTRSSALGGPSVKKYARPLGATTVALGLVVLGIGFVRYFQTQAALTQGKFPVSRLPIAAVALVLAVLVVVVFGVLIAGGRHGTESVW